MQRNQGLKWEDHFYWTIKTEKREIQPMWTF